MRNDKIKHLRFDSIPYPIIFCLILWSSTALAQNGFHAGVSGALNSSWILNQNNYETLDNCPTIASSELAYRFQSTYNVGGVLGYRFKEKFGVQLEVFYNLGGQKYEDTFSPGAECPDPYHVERSVRLRYIQLPLLFKYYVPVGEKIDYFVMGGPQAGFRVGASETVIANDNAKLDLDPTEDKFRNFDFGFAFRTGIDYQFHPRAYLSTGLLTYIGVLDVNGEMVRDEGWYSKNDDSYQKSRNFRAGISLGIHWVFHTIEDTEPFDPEVIPPKD